MAFQRIVITFLVLFLFTFTVKADVFDFYGEQYINSEIGELMAVVVADNIHADLPESLDVEGLMGVSSLSYLDTQDGIIDFLITIANKDARNFILSQGYLYNEFGKLLLEKVDPIHMTVGKDRSTIILQIPVNLIEDGGKYYFQIYTPRTGSRELFLSWPILVGK